MLGLGGLAPGGSAMPNAASLTFFEVKANRRRAPVRLLPAVPYQGKGQHIQIGYSATEVVFSFWTLRTEIFFIEIPLSS
jgi:hypothetical protein